MRVQAVVVIGLALLLSGCGTQQTAAPASTVTVNHTATSQQTVVSVSVPDPETVTEAVTETETLTEVSTYDVQAEESASSAAASSSAAAAVAKKGGAQYDKQMKAAGLKPDPAAALTACEIMDLKKDPIESGLDLDFEFLHREASAVQWKTFGIEIATLCPQHKKAYDAAVTAGASASSAAAAANQVTYSVSGSASSASVTYSGAGGDTVQDNDVSVPWSKELTIPAGDYRFLSILAQNGGGGDITCTIKVGGEVVKTNTSTGDFAIADCSAS